MKKVFLSCLIVILSSCNSNDDLNLNANFTTSEIANRSVANNVLSFDTELEYENLLDSLSLLTNDELLLWESKQLGFKSMYRVHSEAVESILSVLNIEEYSVIKSEYNDRFIFNDKDASDLSIYMPLFNYTKAITLNEEGCVYIAGEKRNFREFNSYNEYFLKLQKEYPTLVKTVENGINQVYVKTSDRKFSARIGTQGNQQAIRVNASKKILFGWVEYTTAYYWRFTPNGPLQFGNEMKSGSDIYITGSPFPNGTKLYMWTRGTGEENRAIMTVQL
ncbi:MAG: DUF4848 domain-containing protein [Bacteroidales bacterium]